MTQSYVKRRSKDKEPAVALYMPGIREYLSATVDEKEIKEAIKNLVAQLIILVFSCVPPLRQM